MKQEAVTERIMRILVGQKLIKEEDYNTIAPFFDQAYAAGFELARKLRMTGKEIVQLSLDGKKIEVYESALVASRKVGAHPDNIRQAARGDSHTAKGFKWKYLDEFEVENV